MLSVKNLTNWDEKKKQADITRAKTNEVRRNNRALKSAGVKKYDSTAGIPKWFKNINSTFNLVGTTPAGRWREWCSKQLEHIGVDYSKAKGKVGRPKMPDSMKKTPVKETGRAEKMKQLLLDNNIHLTPGRPSYEDVYLIEYPEIQFLMNGKLRDTAITGSNSFSVHSFLNNFATI